MHASQGAQLLNKSSCGRCCFWSAHYGQTYRQVLKHFGKKTQYAQPLTLISDDNLLQNAVVHFADPRRRSVRYARDVVRVEAVPVRPDAAADQHGHDISTERLYLREASVDNAELPTSVGDLSARAGIRVVLTNAEDPDGTGCFVPYRVAFYVAGREGALHNARILLVDFFLWKQRQMAREKPFDVHVHPYVGVPLDTAGLERCNYMFNDESIRPPLGVFQAHPVYGKRIVALHVEPLGADVVSVLIGGRIWSYRDRLDAYDVPGVSHRPSAGSAKCTTASCSKLSSRMSARGCAY